MEEMMWMHWASLTCIIGGMVVGFVWVIPGEIPMIYFWPTLYKQKDNHWKSDFTVCGRSRWSILPMKYNHSYRWDCVDHWFGPVWIGANHRTLHWRSEMELEKNFRKPKEKLWSLGRFK